MSDGRVLGGDMPWLDAEFLVNLFEAAIDPASTDADLETRLLRLFALLSDNEQNCLKLGDKIDF